MKLDPYQPTPHEEIDLILDSIKFKPNETLLELGSGDARITVAAVKRGINSTGYELDPELVRKTQEVIKSLPARIIEGDFMDISWSDYDVIISGDIDRNTAKLVKQKFKLEAKPEARLAVGWGPELEIIHG